MPKEAAQAGLQLERSKTGEEQSFLETRPQHKIAGDSSPGVQAAVTIPMLNLQGVRLPEVAQPWEIGASSNDVLRCDLSSRGIFAEASSSSGEVQDDVILLKFGGQRTSGVVGPVSEGIRWQDGHYVATPLQVKGSGATLEHARLWACVPARLIAPSRVDACVPPCEVWAAVRQRRLHGGTACMVEGHCSKGERDSIATEGSCRVSARAARPVGEGGEPLDLELQEDEDGPSTTTALGEWQSHANSSFISNVVQGGPSVWNNTPGTLGDVDACGGGDCQQLPVLDEPGGHPVAMGCKWTTENEKPGLWARTLSGMEQPMEALLDAAAAPHSPQPPFRDRTSLDRPAPCSNGDLPTSTEHKPQSEGPASGMYHALHDDNSAAAWDEPLVASGMVLSSDTLGDPSEAATHGASSLAAPPADVTHSDSWLCFDQTSLVPSLDLFLVTPRRHASIPSAELHLCADVQQQPTIVHPQFGCSAFTASTQQRSGAGQLGDHSMQTDGRLVFLGAQERRRWRSPVQFHEVSTQRGADSIEVETLAKHVQPPSLQVAAKWRHAGQLGSSLFTSMTEV
jgi:hypothetical protein